MIAWITAGPFLVISTFHYRTIDFGLFQGLIFSAFIIGTKLTRTVLDKIGAATTIKWIITTAMIASLLAASLSVFIHSFSILINYIAIIFAAAGSYCPILGRKAIESSNESMGLSVTISGFLAAIFGSSSSALISTFYNEKISSLIFVLFILITGSFILCSKAIKFSVFKP